MEIKGILIPIGGNEDKGGDEREQNQMEYIEEGILARVVRESGGKEAMIVVIPTASRIPVEVGENYLKAFGKLQCKNVTVLDLRKRKDADLQKNLQLIRRADCIMFSGGDQSKITKKIRGTRLHHLMVERYVNEGIVIAGTSAGAMCMSSEMITGGSSKEALIKDAVLTESGMGFISNLIIDSHFIRRGRFGRLAEAVAKFPELLGIGLAEDTGLVIKQNDWFEIIGSGMVILFDPRELRHNNVKLLDPGTPMSLVNLKVHVLTNGDKFNITKRQVKVLPLDAPFITA
ncbi:MAG: cyanophycinase [Flavobacteriaceae bacterium]|nr:cyanophycinase [Flavobacteriaceae bacterium]